MEKANENTITYIKDSYIDSKMEPHFAVLIKGDWGCGKTFLVKKILEEQYGENYKDKVIWLSVYGLSSIQQLRQKLFEKIHPILTSKVAKFAFATVKAGLKASMTFDFNKDQEDDLSFDLSIPDFDVDENGKKAKIKKLLIVDDIERCSIPMSELFGFFSEEILEKKVRAIFITNDAKIKESNVNEDEKGGTLNDYKSIKEKIIGMEFEVIPDVPNAVKSFINEIGLEKNETLLSEKVTEVLSKLDYKNLRSVRQAFVFMRQIFDILEKGNSKGLDEKYIADVVEYFLVLFVQKVTGKIKTGDDFLYAIEAYSKAQITLEKYKEEHKDDGHPLFLFLYAKVPLQNLYFKIIQEGDFSSEPILEDYTRWTVPNDKRTPYQKLTYEWFNYSDTEFNEYYNAVEKEFDKNEILNQYMIVRWADLKFELSEQGIISESIDDIKNVFLRYISLNNKKLIPCDSFIAFGDYSTRCKEGLPALNEIKETLKKENKILLLDKTRDRFIELYSANDSENISKLVRFISYGEENSHDIPILSLIDINDFYQKLKNFSYYHQVAIYQSFEERYGKKNNSELRIAYSPDVESVRKLSALYTSDTGSTIMSPENAKKKWLSEWYNELYEYMKQFQKEE